jgi:hypothetical protein
MRNVVISIALASIVVASTSPASAATPIKIVDRPRVAEYSPSVSDDFTVWSADTVEREGHFHGYVLPAGGTVTQIPVRGDVRTGGIITSGTYAGQIPLRQDGKGDAEIRFYDLAGGTLSNPPAGVNTSRDEFAPSVSGDYLAFIRGINTRNLFLYQFSTQQFTKLASDVARVQVNGDYVGYSVFCSAPCRSIVRYQISTATTAKLSAPRAGRSDYDAAVTADGTIFFVEGAARICGRRTKIRTWNGSTVSTVWRAPDGHEVGFMNLDTLGGLPTLSYSLAVCPYSSERWGAYRIDV